MHQPTRECPNQNNNLFSPFRIRNPFLVLRWRHGPGPSWQICSTTVVAAGEVFQREKISLRMSGIVVWEVLVLPSVK